MNPFDLRGPQFLAFYVAAGIAAVVVYRLWRLVSDQRGEPGELPSEPYLLSHLRGGRAEALRTALFGFLASGSVLREGRLLTRAADEPPRPLVPFEAELWAALERWRTFDGLVSSGVAEDASAPFQQRLEQLGYRRPERQLHTDRTLRLLLVAALVVVAVVRIAIALDHGHTNVFFLVVLLIFVVAVGAPKPGVLTSRGRRALEAAQALFEGQRGQLWGSAPLPPEEVGMVMAAFGVVAFRSVDYPFLAALGSPRMVQGGGNGGGGTGASCGSGGSSCGSSCGGGGGGGCGGCGS